MSTLNSPVIYVLCFPLRYPVPLSVIQVCSLSLTIGSMLPQTVSYTAWLRCTITSPKPTQVLKFFTNPSLLSNWKLIKCYSSPITPSPYLPQPLPSPPHFHPCRAQSLETSFNFICQILTLLITCLFVLNLYLYYFKMFSLWNISLHPVIGTCAVWCVKKKFKKIIIK